MSTRSICRPAKTFSAITRFGKSIHPSLIRLNHSRSNFQLRDPEYSFYDLSIQQPVAHSPVDNPFPAITERAKATAKENEKQEQMASRMDEESGRTTGAGKSPTPPPIQNIIFGSRLAGPASRPAPPAEKIKTVEGIKVPPRPEEPDNCCMSGCVHCVWDIYREDIEDWQSLRQKARAALKAKGKRIPAWLGGKAAKLAESDPLADIDPGLRAFMELEKRLREKKDSRQHAVNLG